MKTRTFLVSMLLSGSIGARCVAQEVAPEIPPAPGETSHAVTPEHAPTYSHPTLPAEGNLWTGSMLIIVAGMFLMAIAVGLLCQSENVEEPPVDDHAHGHDDAHGADHGHGAHH